LPISIFGFRALWSPFFLAAIVLLILIYFGIAAYFRKSARYPAPDKKQAACFIAAMAILYIVKGSPLDLLGHIMFSIHMVQMSVLYLVAAPLMMLGLPVWMWEKAARLPVIKTIFRFFKHPVITVSGFNIVFSFYHIPSIFDYIKVVPVLHSMYTIILFGLAVLMWRPLIISSPGQYQLNGLKKIAYLFSSAILLTPACGLIIFAQSPVYQTYQDGAMWLKSMHLCVPAEMLSQLGRNGSPMLFSQLPVLEDQQLGGVMMKLVQEVVYGFVLFRIFFAWAKKEQEEADAETDMMLKERSQLFEAHNGN
jgi:putative membrane protein